MADGLSLLETLTDTAIDSALGYEKAAEKATNAGLKGTLTSQASKRRNTVEALNAEIRRLGGEARTNGSTAGAAHRAFTTLADAFGDSNERAAERVEEGEDYIEKKFREALDKDDFTPETRAVVQNAHREISEGEKLTDRLEEQFD
ncbi:PA2169 family four-helix-bundle protein [Novosphingopyxis iocasae]|uniref:PA2169 family four-helix-bundle protein n=1 Tax=Novosphingopyxis iocasae TaxID=2762729 RepID=UPI0016513343|nr:PA2169 family four-helix-bundle protein [Novosphingopyxis iocasae]